MKITIASGALRAAVPCCTSSGPVSGYSGQVKMSSPDPIAQVKIKTTQNQQAQCVNNEEMW